MDCYPFAEIIGIEIIEVILYNIANSTHHASAIGMRTEVGHFFQVLNR